MGLKKLIKNRISGEWKNIFNHNVEQLERKQEENQTSHKATNKRIDNLVLASGGDSPNEVTDARSDTQGNAFETLKGRLDSEQTWNVRALKDANELIAQQRIEINRLNGTIEELYESTGGATDIYVSAERGNDKTGDGTEEKPFKTIQEAVNTLPFLSSVRFYIHVEPGSYLEDVVVDGVNANAIVIVATNNDTTDAVIQPTGVYVRSIQFNACQAYCRVRGLSQTDVANSRGYFIHFIGSAYGAVDNCYAKQNTKNLNNSNFRFQEEYRCFVWDRTNGNIYGTGISNQKYAISSMFTGIVRVTNDVKGSSNNIVYYARGAIVFVGAEKYRQLDGSQMSWISYGGQVFDL
ncbi:hypothetical protein [Tetragenococcus halophilus]|uniref:hypothetical protein n=1 Tax=Tetragenococcus halophilus TaxID=51669 RepID=UPI00209AB3F8|nr:hypothetical protein [Tetragenococcus halophilus]MCO8292661.1 hypothetical protein [Tetragenococcus halophilus]